MAMDTLLQAARRVFAIDEGDRSQPYRDSGGNWTIGRGRLIGENLTDLALSRDIIEAMFKEDFFKAVAAARVVLGAEFYDTQNLPRQIAIATLTFTLGQAGFAKFHETIAAMKAGDWGKAADRILATKWSRDVDPRQRINKGRDDRIAFMLKEGKFHEEYIAPDLDSGVPGIIKL